MRRTILAVASLAIALVVQLVVLNGLHLPGGGVPDLMLVLVAVLAATGSPVRGMVTGFVAGLAVDIAPPGSAVLGEYALTFCLVGWAAGKLSRVADQSALRALAGLAAVVVLGEALVAGISIGLDPAQFSLAHARQVLPSAVAYDLILLPFLLYLGLRARVWAEAGPLDSDLDPASIFNNTGTARRQPGRHQPAPQPRIALASGRPHAGWVATGRAGRDPAFRHPATPRGLRPGHGVAGSAAAAGLSGPSRPGLPGGPVNIRFGRDRGAGRNFGAIGNPVGSGLGRHPGQHPGGSRPGSSRGFKPHPGATGGSASGQAAALIRPPTRPVSINFSSRRGDASVGRSLGTPRTARPHGSGLRGSALRGSGPGGSARRAVAGSTRGPALAASALGNSALRGSALRGSGPGGSALARPRTGLPAGGQRARTGVLGLFSRKKAAPKFRSASSAPPRSQPKAAPKFRHASMPLSPALAGGAGASTGDVLAARRRQAGAPRLHLSASRPGDRLLATSAVGLRAETGRPATPRFKAGSLAPPARPARRRPRFGHRRSPVLRFLVGRKWLASTRMGGRARVWLMGKRNGGKR